MDANILETIIAEKRVEVASRAAATPVAVVKERGAARPAPLGFCRALREAAAPAVIAEVKRASPSKGLIRPDLEPLDAARSYERGGAACLSVLTDEKFFQGKLEFVTAIKQGGVKIPIIRKDFTCDTYQVWESLACGADALLLIVAALNDTELEQLAAETAKAGLDVLVEVHSREELARTMRLLQSGVGAVGGRSEAVIGINNRDLRTFATDLAVTEDLLSWGRAEFPELAQRLVVSESGIRNGADLRRLTEAGAGAFLVGESLVAAGIPEKILRGCGRSSGCRDESRESKVEGEVRGEGEGVEVHDAGVEKGRFAVGRGGHYGPYGGRYAPEVLMPALIELEECFEDAKRDAKFLDELDELNRTYIGRPTPLYFCKNLTAQLGGAKIYIKNEGVAHTGAHKINHCVGQALLAARMGKRRIVAETGAGQHGLASSAVSARFGFECVVYMGARDVARQRPNVFWMEQLGAKVVPVNAGGQRLKDAVNAALKDWITNVRDSHYLLGSCVGPHPFPEMNRYFQSVVGREIKEQLREATGKLPDYVVACVGGGSNAIGAFDVFLDDERVQLVGVEAGGVGKKIGEHAARFRGGMPGVVEGFKSYWLQDNDGQVANTQSISAGLDYAGVGPLHAFMRDAKRVKYVSATDREVLKAFKLLAGTEGIFPALESAHALAQAAKMAPKLPRSKSIVVNISGRAEKDIFILARYLADERFDAFLKDYLETRGRS